MSNKAVNLNTKAFIEADVRKQSLVDEAFKTFGADSLAVDRFLEDEAEENNGIKTTNLDLAARSTQGYAIAAARLKAAYDKHTRLRGPSFGA